MGLLFPKKKKKKKKHSGLFWISAIALGIFAAGGSGTAVITHHGGGSSPGPPVAASLADFQACVIHRESGGDPTVWNRQGYPYWGLYQFGKPLWTGNGGSADTWGKPSTPASEQTRIFYNVMSHYKGCENWTPSDGCTYPANGCG